MLQPLHGGKAAVRERAVSNCQSSGSCREDSTMWSVWCSIKCSKAAHSMNRPGLHLCAGRKVRTGAHRHSMRPVGSTNSCTTAVMKTHGGATHVSLHAQHHNHSATRMQAHLLRFMPIASNSAWCAPCAQHRYSHPCSAAWSGTQVGTSTQMRLARLGDVHRVAVPAVHCNRVAAPAWVEWNSNTCNT